MELAWQEDLYPAGQQHNPSISLQAFNLVERELAREAGDHKITRRRSEPKRIIYCAGRHARSSIMTQILRCSDVPL